MPEGDWKAGREFRVRHFIITEGRQFKPESTYTAEPFGRVGCAGHIFALNDAQKRSLLDVINWLDAPSKISPVLKRMIEQDPESPMIRAMVRVEMGITPPKAEIPTTAKGWMEFIDKTEPVVAAPVTGQDGERMVRRLERMREVIAATPADPATFVAPTTTNIAQWAVAGPGTTAATPADFMVAQPPRREEIAIRVRGHIRVHGRTYFSRTDYYEGEMMVPIDVIQQGEEAIMDYLHNYIGDQLEARRGEEEYGDSDIDDDDGIVVEEHNVNRVIRGLRADRPELFNEF